jgi:hypothetical protein
MDPNQHIIDQTKKWVRDVVIGCNFCPFASKVVKENRLHYVVETAADLAVCLETLLNECIRLDNDETIETTLIIFPNSFESFEDYLDLVELGEKLLVQNEYEGVYQLASFHPLYRFADAPGDDPANYTNRSVYPMLHLLREESIEEAIANFPDPDSIPERNINFARQKGLAAMKLLRDNCY